MKFKIRSLQQILHERVQRRKEWRQWFAWHPIRFNGETIIWWEKVYRTKNSYNEWMYSFSSSGKQSA